MHDDVAIAHHRQDGFLLMRVEREPRLRGIAKKAFQRRIGVRAGGRQASKQWRYDGRSGHDGAGHVTAWSGRLALSEHGPQWAMRARRDLALDSPCRSVLATSGRLS